MINKIKLCWAHAGRINFMQGSDPEFTFQPGYNVLIGPNRAGKSTILKSIAECQGCEIQKTSDNKVMYVTTETLNPLFKTGNYKSLEEVTLGVRAMFSSSGEIAQTVIRNLRYRGENCFLIDSPETGQDIENLENIYHGLKKISRENQVIIATHHPLFCSDANIIELQKGYFKKLIELNKKERK